MKIIYKNIIFNFIVIFILSSLLLLFIDLFFTFIEEFKLFKNKEIDFLTMALYVLCLIPLKIYILFPWSMLISTVCLLCLMENNNMLLIIQISGISLKTIMAFLITINFVIAIFIFIIGEVFLPKFDYFSKNFKMALLDNNSVNIKYSSIWHKLDSGFIYINDMKNKKNIKSIFYYKIDKDLKLIKIKKISQIILIDNNYIEKGIKIFYFTDIFSIKTKIKSKKNSKIINLNIFENISYKRLDRYSISELITLLKFKFRNDMEVKSYELAILKKIYYPINIIVIIYISMIFLFKFMYYYKNIGVKIITAIIIGAVFHLLNSIFITVFLLTNVNNIISVNFLIIIISVLFTCYKVFLKLI
ncbi:MAG TPA: LptF/LptG family permease [Candidatus Azoamicus sp. OHIO1]